MIITDLMVDRGFQVVTTNEAPKRDMWAKLTVASIGDSGYSFGPQQIDCSKNGLGKVLLTNFGLPTETVDAICQFSRIKNPKPATKKQIASVESVLRENLDKLEQIGKNYIRSKLAEILSFKSLSLVAEIYPALVYHFLDMEVQFNLNAGGMVDKWLLGVGVHFSQENVCEEFLRLKLKTAWGKKHPADVTRRYNNIQKLLVDFGIFQEYRPALAQGAYGSTDLVLPATGKVKDQQVDQEFLKELYGVGL